MKICFYTPFKPLGHPHPSGDLVTATGIFEFLARRGHQMLPASSLRCRWIYWKPWLRPRLVWERQRLAQRFGASRCDLWFSYHSYYKAPDMLGPHVARRIGIPYVLFQGIYSTKRRRDPKTRLGFHLNRQVLRAACHVFTNKRMDWVNLRRLLPEERLTYVAPGLHSRDFTADPGARADLRRQWGVREEPVVLSVAMFRPGVKAEGLTWVIRTCSELRRRGCKFTLVIVGDGKARTHLEQLAREEIRDRCIFIGQAPRRQLYRYYSAADLFVFPGIQEALGMVYLEAQSCGLPVVAFDNAGVPEAVQDGRTGLLVPLRDGRAFAGAIERLLTDAPLRRQMGASARTHIREAHELDRNYGMMEEKLKSIIKPF